MEDCFIACVDGLKGLPEAIETVFPHARVQLCIVHQVRKSLRYVPWKERKPVAGGLRSVYTAPSEEAALAALEAFERQWSEKYPAIAPLWRKDWERLAPFFELCACDPQGGLHYQCDRIAELQPAQNRQGAGRFPQRRRGAQAALPGPARSVEEMEATHTRLEGRTQPVRHTLRGQSAH